MHIITIHYPSEAGATFDHDYYRNIHLPLVGQKYQPYGLGFASVLKGEQALDGTVPPFLITTILSFPTERQAQAAAASEGTKEILADIANFTNVSPFVQFNTSVS